MQIGGLSRGGGAPFSPSKLYAAGQAGLWGDPSDLTSGWQLSTGATALTMPGAGTADCPVGYSTDKSGRGIHLLQASAAARPVLSARVNLLAAKSEQFDTWPSNAVTVTPNSTAAPDGAVSADTLTGTAGGASLYLTSGMPIAGGVPCTASVHVLKTSGATTFPMLAFHGVGGTDVDGDVILNTNTGVLAVRAGVPGAINLAVTSEGFFWRVAWSIVTGAANTGLKLFVYPAGSSNGTDYDGAKTGAIVAWGAQIEIGSTATRYQKVTDASNYDTAGFPLFYRGDGVDDGLAASFAAGTLTSNMTLLMAIKRTSAAGLVALFRAAGSANYVGSMTSGGAGAASALSGTPTYRVDGVDVPGGAGTTEGQLHTALTVGPWHILEIRGIDMSAWVSAGLGYFSGGYPGAANYGGHILRDALSEADCARARRYLARKVGVSVA